MSFSKAMALNNRSVEHPLLVADTSGVLHSAQSSPKDLAVLHFSRLATPLADCSFDDVHFRMVKSYVGALPGYEPDVPFDATFRPEEFRQVVRELSTGTDRLPYELFCP